MVSKIDTVAFVGITARLVNVEVHVSSGLPAFNIVGLADKAVSEARERVRAALSAIGLALPAERITVNLSPADLPKEGSHYDLPIALGLLKAMGAVPSDAFEMTLVMGELGLDGVIRQVSGALPAAVEASARGMSFICPQESGPEAAWAGDVDVIAAPHLMALLSHVKGSQLLAAPTARMADAETSAPDLADIKGQEGAKRALEIAAAGGHNMLMIGPPGSGKSMLAARLPGILPAMSAAEALEYSMIASIAGEIEGGAIRRTRPFRAPHHSASQPAIIGGGAKAKPGEVSLAHAGVLFLDELPEFSRQTLESLRQPIETHKAVIARAQAHVTYPARFQLVAAMNPCRCGYLSDVDLACSRAPKCAQDYQSKISGPLYDRFDLTVEVEALSALDLTLPRPKETSAEIGLRVAAARERQLARYQAYGVQNSKTKDTSGVQAANVLVNAQADGELLEAVTALDGDSLELMRSAAGKLKLSARGYHRVLRVARTIADLAGMEKVAHTHIAEALSYRRTSPQSLKISA